MPTRLLKRLRKTVAHWLDPEPQQVTDHHPVKLESRLSGLAELEARLGQLKDANLMAGNIQLLGIQRIIDKFGDEWPQYQERIDTICSNIINRHLGPSDFFTAYEELGYLILFGNLTPERAQLRCAMIRDEIEQRLLGKDRDEHSLEIRTAVIGVDGRLMFEHLKSERDLRNSLAHAATTDEEIVGESAGVPAADVSDLIKEPLSDVECVFRPVWNVNRRAVSTYFCDPARRHDGHLETGEHAIPSRLKPDVRLNLDLKLLRRTEEELARLHEAGRKLVITVPLHMGTLATSHTREPYLRRCYQIPDRLRPFLMFELTGGLGRLPPATVSDLVAKVRPFCRGVLGRYDITQPAFEFASSAGVHAVGCDLGATDWNERRLMRAMDKFVSDAEGAGLHAYMRNVRSISLATAAVASGARYLDGDGILSVVDVPDHVYRYDYHNLYSPIVAQPNRRRAAQPAHR